MPVGETLIETRLGPLRLTATAIDSDAIPHLAPAPDVPAGRFAAEQALASSQFEALQAKRHNLQAAIAQRRAELRTTRDTIEPMAESARISKARAEDYGRLVEGKYVGRHDYLLREQERIAAERDLATQRNRLQEIGSALSAAEEELRVLVADFRQQTLDQLREAEQKVAQGTPELAKAGRRDGLMTLCAPVDGTVQQLAVRAVGEGDKWGERRFKRK
ncbi:HlyD family secretion protein [Xanthomonas sp.]|uniref:HlyD family secretion protein n=1 Tax=Xanthomonas sp. TaxID=29446 RepID=UPI001F1305BE|nr:HlyD family secretion protein [Xanthomonas sp.]